MKIPNDIRNADKYKLKSASAGFRGAKPSKSPDLATIQDLFTLALTGELDGSNRLHLGGES
jgi:hypothetical protein